MRRLSFILLVCYEITQTSAEPASTKPQFRIIGGTVGEIQQCPYLAQLNVNGAMICGAAILSKNFAITAGHCSIPNGVFTLRVGTSFLNKGGEVVPIKLIRIHPEFKTSPRLEADMAILELKEPLQFSDFIQPIQLPDVGEPVPYGETGIVSGWGSVAKNGKLPSFVIRQIELVIKRPIECFVSYFGSINTKTSFCAGSFMGMKDACSGDSGGPLVVNDILYGLVSAGVSCADPLHPGLYTSIPGLREFIQKVTSL